MVVLSRRTILLYLLRKRLNRKKRFWVRKLFLDRKLKGEYHVLVQDMRLHDEEYFFRYFRMTPHQYEVLLSKVAPRIQKSSNREYIGPSERLCVTLRYLATGDAQSTIAAGFRISPTSIGRIIEETCAEIWNALVENYIAAPTSPQNWKEIASAFERNWNFPHCIGAIDGKHVVVQAPANTGSMYFNYKKTFSIVLMATCDANYTFTIVDIGDIGRNSDGGVFSNSKMGNAFIKGKLGVPEQEVLHGTNTRMPYVLVGDEAFPLRENLMKPYPKEILGIKERIYNYRLSRARRTIENAFGIAASRFRIFRRPINARVHVVVNITKAVIALHNYLMAGKKFHTDNSRYCPSGYTDTDTRLGDWRDHISDTDALQPLNRAGSNNYSRDAKQIRERYRDYFASSAGQIDWQWDMVTRT